MEELVGGQGPKTLPYAVRDHFNVGELDMPVQSSEVWVEVENGQGDVVTLRRAILDDMRDSKLIEVFRGPSMPGSGPMPLPTPTYLHDALSAQVEQGFFYFFEKFIGLDLPRVASNAGLDTKLYLQAVFAAHAVEQKRGWTDYIANIPYYGIRDARTRVTEYILGLGVFATAALRARLNAESSSLANEWTSIVAAIRREALDSALVVEGLPGTPSPTFEAGSMMLSKTLADAVVTIDDYLASTRVELARLQAVDDNPEKNADAALMAQLNEAEAKLPALLALYERAVTGLALERRSLTEFERLVEDTEASLRDNKTTRKLRDLGAVQDLKSATGMCPTCDQPVDDSLIPRLVAGPQMDLDTNIQYLEAQRRMLQRQVQGQAGTIRQAEATAGLRSQRQT
jgi:hypothetical protein